MKVVVVNEIPAVCYVAASLLLRICCDCLQRFGATEELFQRGLQGGHIRAVKDRKIVKVELHTGWDNRNISTDARVFVTVIGLIFVNTPM